ncbi:MAG: Tex family protein [Peptoniphilus sp.]|nr:Tex family protein [Peptoniphilus sp.]MDD7362607.1 Tex family protein [Bacillota bacterium]MDY6044994.1 Tex family protein [Peptoniphilus sp.]
MNIAAILSREFQTPIDQIEATLSLLEEGNTVPFIARYRKEATGNMQDEVLRKLESRKEDLQKLDERKQTVLSTVESQGKLTDALKKEIDAALDMQTLEDLYRPYKPKRRTRATAAEEKGLRPLAELLKSDEPFAAFNRAVDDFEGLEREAILQGVNDILAEDISNHAGVRRVLKSYIRRHGVLVSEKGKEPNPSYAMYETFSAPFRQVKNHNVLAVNRGEGEGALRVKIQSDEETLVSLTRQLLKPAEDKREYLEVIIKDALNRLLYPSLERELRRELKDRAEESAIEVFAQNLKPLLLTPPLGHETVLGIDPGFRTGCKVAVVDENGKFLDHDVIYPVPPKPRVEEATAILSRLIDRYDVDVIAIGSGTASYETEQFVSKMIEEQGLDVSYAIVNEDGASVYSASERGIEEFPDLDVTVRGAISIARRLQDPLAELVKIEPRHIGVGQYQHDLNKKALDERLEGVVEGTVNEVGVDINLASSTLLSFVSGITANVAKNIVNYREEEGAFTDRSEFKKVKGLGEKVFKQSAGFLRIPDGENILDRTGVHPESYAVADLIMREDALTDAERDILESAGAYTVEDIRRELKKPGRDPRDDAGSVGLKRTALTMEDLKPGLELDGVVTNVVDFGAFIDIGVKKEGLLHISKIVGRGGDIYSKLKVGDRVKVQIEKVDEARSRISLDRAD